MIKAVCRGSGQATYVVRIRWSRPSTDNDIDLDDTCSCPLGGGCKHCVAVHPHGSSTGRPADWARRLRISRPTGVGPSRTWPRRDDDDGAAPAGLALQVVVEHPTPSRYVTSTGPRVTIRPMRRGKAGKWIKTGASWRDISSPYSRPHADTRPAAAGGPEVTHGQRAARPLLREHPDGTTRPVRPRSLVPARAGGRGRRRADRRARRRHRRAVRHQSSAPASTSRPTSPATSPSRPRSRLDDEPLLLADGRSGLIGTPTHGLWIRDGAPVGPHRRSPLPCTRPSPGSPTTEALTVPAHDVEELLDVYHPALARHAAVDSSDRSVTITTSRFDGIVLIVERTALDAADPALVGPLPPRRAHHLPSPPLAPAAATATGPRRRPRSARWSCRSTCFPPSSTSTARPAT